MLEGYPKQIVVKDGTRVTLRPMVKEDRDALVDFFTGISTHDRQHLRDDVGNPKVIEEWVERLDYDRVLPILALVDGRVVANATLHKRKHGLTKHLGKMRIVVDPEYRSKGLGTWLMLDLVNAAMHAGLEKVVAEFAAELESPAIRAAERLGFHRAAVISDYYKDVDGKEYDLVFMVKSLYPDWGDY
ncbi:MAG: GNAT family N-acetyltransferase [Chloroflexi bacterium]|nr:GNAT family N-acetyltransferase [Chloroflexota bacterium]